jgi:hypothetical protein
MLACEPLDASALGLVVGAGTPIAALIGDEAGALAGGGIAALPRAGVGGELAGVAGRAGQLGTTSGPVVCGAPASVLSDQGPVDCAATTTERGSGRPSGKLSEKVKRLAALKAYVRLAGRATKSRPSIEYETRIWALVRPASEVLCQAVAVNDTIPVHDTVAETSTWCADAGAPAASNTARTASTSPVSRAIMAASLSWATRMLTGSPHPARNGPTPPARPRL